jgi:hypothetical protein
MTDFVAPSYLYDGQIIDEIIWNEVIVDNLNALNERLYTHCPYAIVENTATETILYTKSVPANSFGPNGFLVADIGAVVQNNSGSTRTPSVRLKIGGSTVASINASIADSANRISLSAKFRVQNKNDDASQLSVSEMLYLVAPGTAGSQNALTDIGTWHTSSKDTSVTLDIELAVFLGAAHATYIFEMVSASIAGPFYFD